MDEPVYARLLGPAWQIIPDTTRRLHQPEPVVELEGRVDIARGSNMLARLLAALMRLPRAGEALPARVRVSRVANDELLERWYDGQRFATLQIAKGGHLLERFGPFTLRFRLHGDATGIRFEQTGCALWGLSLPVGLAPKVTAREYTQAGEHRFDVALTLPGPGLIIGYRGRLAFKP